MTKLQPSGMFATAYGVEVPVYKPAGVDLGDPDGFAFTPEAVAYTAGIYADSERARFIADALRLKAFPAFDEYGGHKVPKVPLRRPKSPIYPQVPKLEGMPTEAWITGALDNARWADRAAFFVRIIGENMERETPARPAAWHGSAPWRGVFALGLSTLLTCALEHLGETEIDCIEAAAMYALSRNPEWSIAGRTWLLPFRETWFRDWAKARPRYTAYAGALSYATATPDLLFGLEDRL